SLVECDAGVWSPTEMTPMGLGVICECGQTLPIEERQAGTATQCDCGRRVVIPLADEFREKPVVPSATTIERRVERLIAAGSLPLPGPCCACGQGGSEEVVPATIECERYTTRVSGGQRFLLLLPLLVFGVFAWVWWREEERLEIYGRDTDVPSPL